ncbi:MAG: SPOR domain-containing protein [Bacteroidota bacterium]
MRKILADLFPVERDRQDFFIALAVVALFLFGGFYYLRTSSTVADVEPLTADELAKKVSELERQRLAFDAHIITDMKDHRPYYDALQTDIIREGETPVLHVTTPVDTTTSTLTAEMPTRSIDTVSTTTTTTIVTSPEISDTATIAKIESAPRISIDTMLPKLADDRAESAVASDEDVQGQQDKLAEQPQDVEDIPTAYDREASAAARAAAEALEAKEEQARRAAAERQRLAAQKKSAATKKKATVTTLKGCHVIVGAFERADNARSFKSQVTKNGFEVAIGKVRGKTYVGIPVKCTDQSEIAKIQARVNKSYNIQSWVLRE